MTDEIDESPMFCTNCGAGNEDSWRWYLDGAQPTPNICCALCGHPVRGDEPPQPRIRWFGPALWMGTRIWERAPATCLWRGGGICGAAVGRDNFCLEHANKLDEGTAYKTGT